MDIFKFYQIQFNNQIITIDVIEFLIGYAIYSSIMQCWWYKVFERHKLYINKYY